MCASVLFQHVSRPILDKKYIILDIGKNDISPFYDIIYFVAFVGWGGGKCQIDRLRHILDQKHSLI